MTVDYFLTHWERASVHDQTLLTLSNNEPCCRFIAHRQRLRLQNPEAGCTVCEAFAVSRRSDCLNTRGKCFSRLSRLPLNA